MTTRISLNAARRRAYGFTSQLGLYNTIRPKSSSFITTRKTKLCNC